MEGVFNAFGGNHRRQKIICCAGKQILVVAQDEPLRRVIGQSKFRLKRPLDSEVQLIKGEDTTPRVLAKSLAQPAA